jgi:putative cell wall-binding protein
MKTVFQVLTLAAFAATALPALADNTASSAKNDQDPKTMLCSALVAADASTQTTVALLVKTAMADDATVKAMADADLTAEVIKRCGAHPDAAVLDAFKM